MNRPGYIYVFSYRNRLFKVGQSRWPGSRFRELQGGSPVKLVYLLDLYVNKMTVVERWLHAKFADKLVTREWFRLTKEDVAWLKALTRRRCPRK